ncbi:hypothetical protein [Candidatus Epulonipiscium viviparus]|uniref:hypothetical protein n=1 Tax=Candidatus Epulonipiscium viviparus TaxID=420336 RepID=UPI002738076E|nr:hypothetical protein [Candidatus Epulopiscium viviparus]
MHRNSDGRSCGSQSDAPEIAMVDHASAKADAPEIAMMDYASAKADAPEIAMMDYASAKVDAPEIAMVDHAAAKVDASEMSMVEVADQAVAKVDASEMMMAEVVDDTATVGVADDMAAGVDDDYSTGYNLTKDVVVTNVAGDVIKEEFVITNDEGSVITEVVVISNDEGDVISENVKVIDYTKNTFTEDNLIANDEGNVVAESVVVTNYTNDTVAEGMLFTNPEGDAVTADVTVTKNMDDVVVTNSTGQMSDGMFNYDEIEEVVTNMGEQIIKDATEENAATEEIEEVVVKFGKNILEEKIVVNEFEGDVIPGENIVVTEYTESPEVREMNADADYSEAISEDVVNSGMRQNTRSVYAKYSDKTKNHSAVIAHQMDKAVACSSAEEFSAIVAHDVDEAVTVSDTMNEVGENAIKKSRNEISITIDEVINVDSLSEAATMGRDELSGSNNVVDIGTSAVENSTAISDDMDTVVSLELNSLSAGAGEVVEMSNVTQADFKSGEDVYKEVQGDYERLRDFGAAAIEAQYASETQTVNSSINSQQVERMIQEEKRERDKQGINVLPF